jgi:hypothetical protein
VTLALGILFGGDPAELLHDSLLFDLALSLHSDSLLFSWQKNQPSAHYGRRLESRYFHEPPGNLKADALPDYSSGS